MSELSLTCPKCGFTGGAGLADLKKAGQEAAARLTDDQLAENYRDLVRIAIRSALPESMWRLPLANVERLPTSACLNLGREALDRLLRPEA